MVLRGHALLEVVTGLHQQVVGFLFDERSYREWRLRKGGSVTDELFQHICRIESVPHGVTGAQDGESALVLTLQVVGCRQEHRLHQEQQQDGAADDGDQQQPSAGSHRRGDGAVVLVDLEDGARVHRRVADQDVPLRRGDPGSLQVARGGSRQGHGVSLNVLTLTGGSEELATIAPEADRPYLVAEEPIGDLRKGGGGGIAYVADLLAEHRR